jgi:hypothetical protein
VLLILDHPDFKSELDGAISVSQNLEFFTNSRPIEEIQFWFEPPLPIAPISSRDVIEAFDRKRFNSVLRHVAIDMSQIVPNPQNPTLHSPRERDDIVHIFKWLRYKKKVQRILKVSIDDLKLPHNDEAVECLQGFFVESLDWRKMDLCPATITHVGPCLREVDLYWSGNNAILRAWSEPEGLPKLKQLRVVRLHVDRSMVCILDC